MIFLQSFSAALVQQRLMGEKEKERERQRERESKLEPERKKKAGGTADRRVCKESNK